LKYETLEISGVLEIRILFCPAVCGQSSTCRCHLWGSKRIWGFSAKRRY